MLILGIISELTLLWLAGDGENTPAPKESCGYWHLDDVEPLWWSGAWKCDEGPVITGTKPSANALYETGGVDDKDRLEIGAEVETLSWRLLLLRLLDVMWRGLVDEKSDINMEDSPCETEDDERPNDGASDAINDPEFITMFVA